MLVVHSRKHRPRWTIKYPGWYWLRLWDSESENDVKDPLGFPEALPHPPKLGLWWWALPDVDMPATENGEPCILDAVLRWGEVLRGKVIGKQIQMITNLFQIRPWLHRTNCSLWQCQYRQCLYINRNKPMMAVIQLFLISVAASGKQGNYAVISSWLFNARFKPRQAGLYLRTNLIAPFHLCHEHWPGLGLSKLTLR